MPHATSTEVPRFHLVRFFEGFSVLLPRSPIVARTVVSNSLACAINRYNRKLYDDANDECENTRCCFVKLIILRIAMGATYATNLLRLQFATRHPTA